MGIGDWGLGIGGWGLGPIPNPQSPIPIIIYKIFYKIKKKINNFIYFYKLINIKTNTYKCNFFNFNAILIVNNLH